MLDEWNLVIVSDNNFNTAAGLASSSSGLSCLGCALATLLGLSEDQIDFSILARLGSGSACRSTQGGFVVWNKGWSTKQEMDEILASQSQEEPSELRQHVSLNSKASRVQLSDDASNFWLQNLCIIICVVKPDTD